MRGEEQGEISSTNVSFITSQIQKYKHNHTVSKDHIIAFDAENKIGWHHLATQSAMDKKILRQLTH